MSSGSYECDVACEHCGATYPVLVEWYYTPGSYYEPPDGETNVKLVFPNTPGKDPIDFPDKCEACGLEMDVDLVWEQAGECPWELRRNIKPEEDPELVEPPEDEYLNLPYQPHPESD